MNKKYFLVAGVIILIIVEVLIFKYHNEHVDNKALDLDKENYLESPETKYSKDSSYFIIIDSAYPKPDSNSNIDFNSRIHIWDTKTRKQINSFHIQYSGFRCLALHPTQKILAFLSDYSCLLYTSPSPRD